MASLETICRTVRARFGLPPTGAPIDPDWLLTVLDELEPEPQPFCERDGLFGNRVRWNECAPKSIQRHQIGRACCAHVLRGMRQLQHSPGRLSEMLCGTSALDTQAEDIRRDDEQQQAQVARVHSFHKYAVQVAHELDFDTDAAAALWSTATRMVASARSSTLFPVANFPVVRVVVEHAHEREHALAVLLVRPRRRR